MRVTSGEFIRNDQFSQNASKEDVRQAYLLAYKEGVKGITIFRSGSKSDQVPTCADPLYS